MQIPPKCKTTIKTGTKNIIKQDEPKYSAIRGKGRAKVNRRVLRCWSRLLRGLRYRYDEIG